MSEEPVLFAEPGARWRAVVLGPALCLAGALIELALGTGVHWPAWLCAALLLAGVTALQVLGARRHGAVRLTATELRQGVETLPTSTIESVFDAPGERAWDDPTHPWEAARALGESHSVPRRHTGIGLRLRDGRLVQAWARNDGGLRAGLQEVVNQ